MFVKTVDLFKNIAPNSQSCAACPTGLQRHRVDVMSGLIRKLTALKPAGFWMQALRFIQPEKYFRIHLCI